MKTFFWHLSSTCTCTTRENLAAAILACTLFNGSRAEKFGTHEFWLKSSPDMAVRLFRSPLLDWLVTSSAQRSYINYKRRNFRSRDELFTFDAATRGNCGQRPPLVFNRGSSSGSDKATRRRDQTRGVSRGARNLEVFFLNGRGLSCLLKWPVLVAATVAPGGLCCVRIKVFFALYIHYTVISSVGSYERSTNF